MFVSNPPADMQWIIHKLFWKQKNVNRDSLKYVNFISTVLFGSHCISFTALKWSNGPYSFYFYVVLVLVCVVWMSKPNVILLNMFPEYYIIHGFGHWKVSWSLFWNNVSPTLLVMCVLWREPVRCELICDSLWTATFLRGTMALTSS